MTYYKKQIHIIGGGTISDKILSLREDGYDALLTGLKGTGKTVLARQSTASSAAKQEGQNQCTPCDNVRIKSSSGGHIHDMYVSAFRLV